MFCLTYYPSQRQNYPDDVDEFRVRYRPSDRTLENFLSAYQDKTIIIDVTESFQDLDVQLLKGLYDKYHNFKIIFNIYNEEYLLRAKDSGIPFFFTNFVTSIDEVYGFMKYEPTDMYICEELGFFLDKVSNILHNNGIKVRVFPNICQSSFKETPSMKTFFIRPEDIPAYSKYVDVFELIADEDRQQVIYKIYKQEKWFGPVKEIIPSFHGNLDSRYIFDSFGVIRSKCNKRCMYKPGSCNICDRFLELAETFKSNKIMVRKAKKKD